MTEAEKKVRAYLAEIGRRGGITSRRELTKSKVDDISGRIASCSANCYTCGVKFRVTIESDEDGVFVAVAHFWLTVASRWRNIEIHAGARFTDLVARR